MAKRNEPLKVERFFVHYDNDGNRSERKEQDITEAELREIKTDLTDRFMGAFGYARDSDKTTA